MPSKNYDNDIDFNYLFKKLDIRNDSEKSWVKAERISFEKFYEYARRQPISSFIRVMELKCRELQPVFHKFFNIDYGFYKANAKIGSCLFFPKAERFRIILPSGANEDEIRTIVAHEIGHLYCAVRFLELRCNPSDLSKNPALYRKFLQVYLSAEGGKKHEAYENNANAIGIFILNERANFYKHRLQLNAKSFCKGFEQIVDDFGSLKTKIKFETDVAKK